MMLFFAYYMKYVPRIINIQTGYLLCYLKFKYFLKVNMYLVYIIFSGVGPAGYPAI